MLTTDAIRQRGDVDVTVESIDGNKEYFTLRNAILTNAKNAQASALCNDIGESYQYYISNMIFGTNGTLGGEVKVVDADRTGLFGSTLINKAVMSAVNPQQLSQAIFTVVVGFDEGNGSVINEMALVMKNGELYSMVAFGGISKNSTIQVTFNWRIGIL